MKANVLKSYIRNFFNLMRKKIIKDEKKKKWVVVKYNNLNAEIRGNKKSIQDLFDYKKIINGPKYFHCDELYFGNSLYGIAQKLREYSGYQYPVNCCIEHGVYFGNYICKAEAIKSGLNGLITFSPQRMKHLIEQADVEVVPIGPYIHYARQLLSDEEIKNLHLKNGKTLLVFPTHSIDRIEANFSVAEFINKIKEIVSKYEFKTVIVCLYYKDILLRRDLDYLKEGFQVVTGGYKSDPLFLDRLKTFINLSDYTISNNCGTHVGYCVFLGKGHYIVNQALSHEAYTKTDFENLNETLSEVASIETDDVKKAFNNLSFEVTENQKKMVSKYWGSECIKTPAEMLQVFKNFEQGKKMKNGVK